MGYVYVNIACFIKNKTSRKAAKIAKNANFAVFACFVSLREIKQQPNDYETVNIAMKKLVRRAMSFSLQENVSLFVSGLTMKSDNGETGNEIMFYVTVTVCQAEGKRRTERMEPAAMKKFDTDKYVPIYGRVIILRGKILGRASLLIPGFSFDNEGL